MKKIISISILIILIGVLLCGCSHETYTDSRKTKLYDKFVVIREDTGLHGDVCLMYDKDTKIIYLCIHYAYTSGVSPYYIIVDGKPAIAIYGVNYEIQE